jgi:probable F420-dependent oxidoreductase
VRLGFSLPQCGDIASPNNVRTVAREAESHGYDSVWVLDRVLYPVAPKVPYAATSDGSLPRTYQRVLDPIGTLTFAAACTTRVSLGTSVLNIPFYNPVLLARQLTSLDVLSEGRLRVAFGTGWSPDEYEAVGVDMKTRGARTYEALEVLRKIWTEDAPEHKGAHFSLPKSIMRLKPAQKSPPPIYMAAFTEAAMKRVATHADGWNPAGIPIPAMKAMFEGIRAMASAAGRDPSKLELVVRANLVITDSPEGANRGPFTGTWDQIREDIAATREIGAHELLFEPYFSSGMDDLPSVLSALRRLRELAG